MQVRVEGLQPLQQALTGLDAKVQRRILRKAGRSGAVQFRDEAKRRVPVDTGLLRRNIIIKRYRERQKGRVVFGVGLVSAKAKYSDTKANRRAGRVGKSYYQHKAYYGHMVEFGTRKMLARPFLRPAFEVAKMRALDAVKNTLKTELTP